MPTTVRGFHFVRKGSAAYAEKWNLLAKKANIRFSNGTENLLTTGFWALDTGKLWLGILYIGGKTVIQIDLDNLNEDVVYKAFGVEGNEGEALNDIYLELFELIGRDGMLKLFKYFRGDKIDCPMRLYRPEFIADLAKQTTNRRERAKIARAAGYTVKFIETMLRRRQEENERETE